MDRGIRLSGCVHSTAQVRITCFSPASAGENKSFDLFLLVAATANRLPGLPIVAVLAE